MMSDTTKTIGMIGLGLLGGGLARRLLNQGWDVCGWDLDEQRRRLFADSDVRIIPAADLIGHCDRVLLSLPTSDVVATVLEQCSSAFAAGRIVVDTTTGVPQEMIEHQRRLLQHGVDYVEATIAGSSVQAEQGRAVVFLGGDTETVLKVAPVIDSIAEQSFHLGPVGSASRFKLVHNLLLGLNRAVLAEGLSFAEALGFDPAETLRILQQTPAVSAVMETKGAKMVARDWSAQAKLSQHLKDVGLIIDQATGAGVKLPLSEQHRQLLEQAVELGFGEADNSAVLEAFLNRKRPPAS